MKQAELALLNEFKGTPWEPVPGQGQGEAPTRVLIPRLVDGPLPSPTPKEDGAAPRKFYILREDIEGENGVGYLPGCPGCSALERKLRPVGHNVQCRARVEANLGESGEGKARLKGAKKRKDDFTQKVQDEDVDKNGKKTTAQTPPEPTQQTQQGGSSSSAPGATVLCGDTSTSGATVLCGGTSLGVTATRQGENRRAEDEADDEPRGDPQPEPQQDQANMEVGREKRRADDEITESPSRRKLRADVGNL